MAQNKLIPGLINPMKPSNHMENNNENKEKI